MHFGGRLLILAILLIVVAAPMLGVGRGGVRIPCWGPMASLSRTVNPITVTLADELVSPICR